MVKRILDSYRVSFSGLSRETWLLSLVILINRCGYMAVPFMSMYITQNMHRSITDAGLVITLFGVGSVLGAMAGGYFTDKFGFRPVQIFSLILSGVFFILFGLISDFTALCGLVVILAFFVESFKPANSTAVASYSTPANLTRSYSLNRLAMNVGFGFGTSVGGILAAINYHLLFWVDGVIYISAGILIALLLSKGRMVRKNALDLQEEMPGKSPWKDAFFVKFLIMVTGYMTCFILLFRLAPVYWKEEMHINESIIGLLLGMNGLVIAVFEMILIQKLANRRSEAFYITAGVIFCGLAFIALIIPFLFPVLLAAAAVLLFTTGEMLAIPYISTFVMNRASEMNRGKYSAAYSVSQSVAQIIGPTLGSYVAGEWGYNMLWLVLVMLSFACAAGFAVLFRGRVKLG